MVKAGGNLNSRHRTSMRFPPSFLDDIRARVPVSEVVRPRIALRKQGREWRGLSPFNKEKTPSFFVNDAKGFYHDFSSGRSGDQFTFLTEVEGLSFTEAVERLAAMAGLPLPQRSPEAEKAAGKRASLHDVLAAAAAFFAAQFAGPAGARARDYAAARGLKRETIAAFTIGYAPAARHALKEHLGARGIPVADMIEAGLLVSGDDIPVPYDRFRDRLMIPIHDARGRLVGFGGRALSPDAPAKYLNSPDTALFHKGDLLFNAHRARGAAHTSGSVVAVEGYMDAIALHQAGLPGVVATMGTALTEAQIAALWALSDEPIICFDGDRAGVAAAHRAIDRILPALRAGKSFRFAFLQGQDPDDLVRSAGAEAFRGVLAGSLPLWDVFWDRETAGKALDTPDSRAILEKRLYDAVGTIRDPLVGKSYYRHCRIQLSDLTCSGPTTRPGKRTRRAGSSRSSSPPRREPTGSTSSTSWPACSCSIRSSWTRSTMRSGGSTSTSRWKASSAISTSCSSTKAISASTSFISGSGRPSFSSSTPFTGRPGATGRAATN